MIFLASVLFLAGSLRSDYGYAHDKLFGDSIYESKNNHTEPIKEGPPSAIFIETATCAFSLNTEVKYIKK